MSRILVKCPSCSNTNSVGGEHLNKHARCGACETVFLVTDHKASQGNATTQEKQISTAPPPVQPPGAQYDPGAPYAPDTSYSPLSPYDPKNVPLPSQQSTFGPAGFRGHPCQVCHMEAGAYPREQISTAGWVTFAVLISFCPLLCWIGLLMKEHSTHCSNCHARIG